MNERLTMRRPEKKWESVAEVDRLLNTASVGRLGTVGPDGPMIKPVNYVYLSKSFYFHSAQVGEKIDHINSDSRVVFQIDREIEYVPADAKPCKATFSYESIIARGKAAIVDDEDEILMVLNALMEKYQPEGGYQPVTAVMAKNVAVIKIVVDALSAKASKAVHSP